MQCNAKTGKRLCVSHAHHHGQRTFTRLDSSHLVDHTCTPYASPVIINMFGPRSTYSSMNATIPPMMAPTPPTLSMFALPVKVTTPPGAPVPVACGAVLVTFLGWPVNVGVLLVETGEAELVITDAVAVSTTAAEVAAAEVAAAVPAGTVLLAWKPAERVIPKPAAQLDGSSPCWGVSW